MKSLPISLESLSVDMLSPIKVPDSQRRGTMVVSAPLYDA